jgi:hypothetical protein
MCIITKKQFFFISNNIKTKIFEINEIKILLTITYIEKKSLPLLIQIFIKTVILLKKKYKINKNEFVKINTIIAICQLKCFTII